MVEIKYNIRYKSKHDIVSGFMIKNKCNCLIGLQTGYTYCSFAGIILKILSV